MFTLTGKWLFSFNSSFKDSCGALFLVRSNEVLELLLFNLLGIELDVPPIFTEMEMKLVVVHTPFVGIDRLAFWVVDDFCVAHVFHVVLQEIELFLLVWYESAF